MNAIKTATIAATIAAFAAAPVAAQSTRTDTAPAPRMSVDVITQGTPAPNHNALPAIMLLMLTMWALAARGGAAPS